MNEDFGNTVADNFISDCFLRTIVIPMGIDLVKSVGKDTLLCILKSMVNRDFFHIEYHLHTSPSLLNSQDTQRAMLFLNPIIRKKIKKNIQDNLKFSEKLAKAGGNLKKG